MGSVLSTAAHAEPAPAAGASLAEIVVTAQRRTESLQDVPLAVSAFDERLLEERAIRDFGSFLRSVPGASLNEIGSLANEVKFRGIGGGNSFVSPTTAVYFADVPVVHTGRNVNASYNFRLVDIDRVEVLRGPQGQLYGANSLGGAIKNVPRAPDLEGFGVRAQVNGFDTKGGGNSWDADASVNFAPVPGVLGVRVTGYTATEGGWYDNVYRGGPRLGTLVVPPPPGPPPGGPPGGTPPPGLAPPGANLGRVIAAIGPAAAAYAAPSNVREDVNESTTDGARATLRWQVSERLVADATFAWEQRRTDGEAAATAIPAVPGRFPNTFVVPNVNNPAFSINYPGTSDAGRYQLFAPTDGRAEDEIALAALTLEYDLGYATLTSVTGFWDRETFFATDASNVSIPTTGVAMTIPVSATRRDQPQSLTQEIRLTSKTPDTREAGQWRWLAGAFYQDLDQDFRLQTFDLSGLDILRTEATLLQPPGAPPLPQDVALQVGEYTDEQFALFGELGYQLTDALSASVSARAFTLEQNARVTNAGFQFTGQGVSQRSNTEDVFTPQANFSWRPSDAQLYYLTYSTGFRTGVVNPDLPQSLCGRELAAAGFPQGIPATDPDTTTNWELGAKLTFADRRVNVNAAVYRVDWEDLQAQVLLPSLLPPGQSRCQAPVVLNVGDAKSQGAELEVQAAVTTALRVDAAFAYTDATYESTFAPAGIFAGRRIENTPRWTGYTGLQLNATLFAKPVYGRVEWNYVGETAKKAADFVAVAQPFDIGDYSVFNARVGLQVTDAIAVELWANNLLDEFGVTYAQDTGGFVPPTVYTIRPRSLGATVRVGF